MMINDGSRECLPVRNYKQRKLFTKLCCFVVFAICLTGYVYVHTDVQSPVNIVLQWAFTNLSTRERKLVLLWTPYFSQKDWLPSTRELRCPVSECDVTSDRSLLSNSSAVVMHWRNINPDDLPECPPIQETSAVECPPLVLFNKEAPSHTSPSSVSKINGLVHFTATYRRDSDIQAGYGRIVNRSRDFQMPDLKSKTSLVCWLVSNCHTPSAREEYVEVMKNHIEVDVYGKCGDKICPHEAALDCYRWLADRCKFYLSFENSLCKDYSTEKLYNALMFNMVPIVMGGDDYDRHLPSHSFINVEDFANPETLALYLKELSQNDAKYLAYFQWKKYYEAVFVPYGWYCDLCELLHKTKPEKLKPHKDIITWWFDEAKCGTLAGM